MNTKTAEEISEIIWLEFGHTLSRSYSKEKFINDSVNRLAAQSAPLATEGRGVWEWVKASEKMPPINEFVVIKDTDGKVYTDACSAWDHRVTDYEWLSRTTLPSQLEGNTLKQEGEQWVWIEVPVSPDTMPKEKGWYNISSNANPKPCGRAFFDGKNFKFTNSSATKGILEQGGKLFWLKRHPSQPLGGYTKDAILDLIDKARTYNDGWVFTEDELLSTLSAPVK